MLGGTGRFPIMGGVLRVLLGEIFGGASGGPMLGEKSAPSLIRMASEGFGFPQRGLPPVATVCVGGVAFRLRSDCPANLKMPCLRPSRFGVNPQDSVKIAA